ncbi:FixH family protein [Emticicia oligotrophica DSM 17448]|uniref:FixH family protein n=1 Tax=Emticicia oligotrophica (strain DSM 17448 / CIP 109782 / MTCC 6937 / GPTSA100-15) TaxID=929562 RepID=A0ABN4AHY4_EMTOG|nr:FixH family protein [Emticicia oligotrophica]AFK01518.1 FixH family protein [Emticicia oligotrophica DSM 17448]
MNWGKSIAIVYLGFVGFMGFLVWNCLQQDDIHLVSKDYYQKELDYQENIDKMNNTNQLSSDLKLNYQTDKQLISLDFPKESLGANGEVNFYRPSDARKDFAVKLNILQSEQQTIPVNKLERGLWVVKVSWNKEGKGYYKEEKIKL